MTDTFPQILPKKISAIILPRYKFEAHQWRNKAIYSIPTQQVGASAVLELEYPWLEKSKWLQIQGFYYQQRRHQSFFLPGNFSTLPEVIKIGINNWISARWVFNDKMIINPRILYSPDGCEKVDVKFALRNVVV